IRRQGFVEMFEFETTVPPQHIRLCKIGINLDRLTEACHRVFAFSERSKRHTAVEPILCSIRRQNQRPIVTLYGFGGSAKIAKTVGTAGVRFCKIWRKSNRPLKTC